MHTRGGRRRAARARAREAREAGHARGRDERPRPARGAALQLLRRRGRRRQARQRPPRARRRAQGGRRGLQARARLLGRRAGGAPGHGRDGVLPQRVQGLPRPRHRLLGRLPGGVLGLGAPGRRAVLVVAPRGAGLPAGGLGARGPHGRRGLLQDGALEVRARGGGRVALDVAQGDVPGQREGGGLLRHAQAGVPLRPGVGGRRARGVRGAAVGVHGVVRRAPAQEVPRGGAARATRPWPSTGGGSGTRSRRSPRSRRSRMGSGRYKIPAAVPKRAFFPNCGKSARRGKSLLGMRESLVGLPR